MCPHCGQAPCVCSAQYQVHSGFGVGTSTAAPAPNKLTILSWNLQNYTHDPRQNFRRSMQNARAEMTAAFVAATMIAHQADMLLIMETGSDAALALSKVAYYRKRMGGPDSDPFMTDLTHATPRLRNRNEISVLAPTADDVHALKNLLDVYELEDVDLTFAPGGVQAAWTLYLSCRPHLDFATALTGDNAADSNALMSGLAEALGSLAESLQTPESTLAVKLVIRAYAPRADVGDAVAALLDTRARFRDGQVDARLLPAMEACAFARLLRAIHLGELDLKDLKKAIPRYQDDRIPAMVCLLSIKYALAVTVDDIAAVPRLQDPSFVYRALEHFGIISIGAEAYAILCTLTPQQRSALLAQNAPLEILRFDADGELLETQRPESFSNHRSAMRLVLPLPGGKFAEMILFHTRFTPPTAITKQKNQVAKTIKMRCDSIHSIALMDPPEGRMGLARLFFGDFNLPANDNRAELTTFATAMTQLGYTRNPSAQPYPATTLKANKTILSGAAQIYNEPYDAVFTMNMTAPQIVSCAALRIIEDMVDHGSFDALVRNAMQGYAGMVYERLIDKLAKKIVEQEKEVTTAQGLLRNPTTAVMPAFALARTELEGCSDAFGVRPLDNNTALAKPVFAQFILDVGLQLLQATGDNSGRAIKALTTIQTLATETQTALTNLETVRAVRIHTAYRYGVSDHIPIKIEIDLDK